MHAEILDFLRAAHTEAGIPTHGLRVVEVGSMVMHGSPRDVIRQVSSYVGIDWRPGPGVDVVGIAHERLVNWRADLVVCCQMLEHDPHWKRTVEACALTVRDGGWALLTWAGPGYPEHELDTAPPNPNGDGPYYENRTLGEVAQAFVDALPGRAVTVRARYGRGTLDALMWARVEAP